MIDAFGVEISKGLRVNLPVKWVERIADSHPRNAKSVKAIADQMSHPEHGYNKPVEIAFSRKHNNYYDLARPNERPKLRLQNGHHRLAAHKLLGRKKIYADITLLRQQTKETIRVVPRGKGFGPNKNRIYRSKVKSPTFSPKNVAVGTAVVGAGGTGIVYAKKKQSVSKSNTPAWQRSEGKNPKGGLNAKGRASARAQGMNLKAPVKGGDNPRRASFLARMGNMPGPERKPNGEPTRLLLSLQAWGASSKADAKKKAAAISARSKP